MCKEILTLADLLIDSSLCQQSFLYVYRDHNSDFPLTINIIGYAAQAYLRAFVKLFHQILLFRCS